MRPPPPGAAWLMYQGGQLFVFYEDWVKSSGTQSQAPRDHTQAPVGLRVRPTPEPQCEVGGACSTRLSLPLQLDPLSLEPLS